MCYGGENTVVMRIPLKDALDWVAVSVGRAFYSHSWLNSV
jgi:hypothetical protein